MAPPAENELLASVRLVIREELDKKLKDLVSGAELALHLDPMKADIDALKDAQKWMWRTIVGAVIVCLISLIMSGKVTIG